MRSLVATITAVALLTSAPLANAADSVTTPVPGWCSATPEVALFELTDHVSDAQCKSDASVRVDPRLVAMVTEKLVYVGPREMGKPSGKEREFVFAWLPTPITDPDNPAQVVFAMNQYQSYRDLKAANGRWMNTVSAVGEKAGEHAAERIFLIGPKWMKSGIAAGVKTGVDLAGAVAFQAPFTMMAPYTAGVSLMPSTAMYAEALFMAPTGTAHGASELVDGVKARNFEQALEGAAEFCGNVGIVLLTAAPLMEGANAAIPPPRPAISMFGKNGVPVLEPPPMAAVPASAPLTPAAAASTAPLRLAPKLTLNQKRLEHIVQRHWENAGRRAGDPPAGHFNETFSSARELRAAVEVAGERGQWSPAGQGRWRVQYDAGEVTGIDRTGQVVTTRIEFIVEPNGSVVTAYPIP